MAYVFDDLATLDMSKDSWRIHVKVGTKIQATIRKTLVYKFQNLLAEDRVCSISVLALVLNNGDYKTTRHGFKVNFLYNIEVQPMNQIPISIHPFSFVSIRSILNQTHNANYLVDVLRIFTGVGREKSYESCRDSIKMNVIEIDSDGYKNEFESFFVILYVYMSFLSIGKVCWQNVFGATKLIFNPDIEEARILQQVIKHAETSEDDTQSLSEIPYSGNISEEEDFLVLTPEKTIQGMKLCFENHFVLPLLLSKKLLMLRSGGTLLANVTRRYRIKVRVSDKIEDVVFVLFDNECLPISNNEATTLLGKTCSEMVDSLHIGDYSIVVPSEIMSLIGKSFLSKVQIKCYGNVEGEYASFLCTPPSQTKSRGVISDLAKDLDDGFAIGSVDKTSGGSSFHVIDLDKESNVVTPSKRNSPELVHDDSCTNRKKANVGLKKGNN
ncbi:uncharacterized protein LOC130737679 [Lotus japonicus]|uniref:uncharacterized protein LOC130737679 n=1 Tax=Lotus japonicus TaxID=34305 RepID=UPI002589CC7B|nr:uncharacterized protein LOC130737679 [Lotus japonicus]